MNWGHKQTGYRHDRNRPHLPLPLQPDRRRLRLLFLKFGTSSSTFLLNVRREPAWATIFRSGVLPGSQSDWSIARPPAAHNLILFSRESEPNIRTLKAPFF